MNTQNTYLRFSETLDGEEVKPIYMSVSDFLHVGTPFDADTGEDLVADLELYFNNKEGKFEKIP